MNNLDQVRAARALADRDQTTRRDTAKLPAMILNNGLLATAAFAAEVSDKGELRRADMKAALDSVARHLATMPGRIAVLASVSDTGTLIAALSGSSAKPVDLQRATAETLSYLGYLKRFAPDERN